VVRGGDAARREPGIGEVLLGERVALGAAGRLIGRAGDEFSPRRAS